ncbi:MAG: transporter [Gammaproteobacteria bacterium]|nr:transporter [Gammaproteobacteria bacterium]
MNYDYFVIAGYFLLVVGIGIVFKKLAKHSTSDYFRGGGRMLWWMVGSAAFMAQFSAWTFTGAAGKAFNDGFAISLVFFGNTFAYLCGWAYFSHRFRQMRVDTPTEGIKRRFGKHNELFYSWAIIVFSIINAGVWLNALGVFTSAFFEADISLTIMATGLTVLFVSVISGAWGVVASDFMQTLIVAIVAVACAIVALVEVGGPVELVTGFPSGFVMGPNMNYGLILFCTFVFFLAKQLVTVMNLNDSYRFLTAKDTDNARKAALLAAVLMGVGSIVFFIPPWATAILYPDATAAYSELGGKATDSVYLTFTQKFMPVGTVGLLVAGLFAATMSSMDSALNKTAGIFVRSVYQPFMTRLERKTDDKTQLRVGRLVSFVNGILVIFVAQYFMSLQDLSLFDLMMSVTTMIQMPLLIPLMLGMIIKKTPSWAPWVTVGLGLSVSWLVANVFTADVFAAWIGIEDLTRREASELNVILTIAAHVFITAAFFCATTFLYREERDQHREETERFFVDLETPVVSDEEQSEFDREQRSKLGIMVIIMGSAMLLMTLIPNPLWGRLLFVLCALTILFIGASLKKSAGQSTRSVVADAH